MPSQKIKIKIKKRIERQVRLYTNGKKLKVKYMEDWNLGARSVVQTWRSLFIKLY